MTTEAELLMALRDRLQSIKGRGTPDLFVQTEVYLHGRDIVRDLQRNHGYDLAGAISLMRPVINELLQG